MSGWRKYDDLAIGSRFPERPARYEVTADVVRAYRAIPEYSLLDPTGPDDRPPEDEVPPTLAALYIRPAQKELKGPPGGVHAKQHFTFHEPVRIGDVLDTSLEVLEKFERKGRRYVVSETRTVNQQGVLVTTGRITQIWGKEE
jgi:hypothetical protein